MKCKVQKICGGCTQLNCPIHTQSKQKQEMVQELMDQYHLKVKVNPVMEAEKNTHYRNKVIVGFAKEKGKVYSGLYAEKSHRIVHSEDCLMHPELINQIIKKITELVQSMKIELYNAKTGTGLLRHVLIRYAHNSQDVMIVFVTSKKIFPSRKNMVQALTREFPQIKTIAQNINPRKTSIVLQDETIILYGEGSITDTLCGLNITFGPSSFYQIHSWQCETLYAHAKKMLNLKKDETVLDTYCGVGTIGLTMASDCKKVVGVEANKEAIYFAKHNAKQNKINNIQFIANDSTKFMSNAKRNRYHFDAIILDPPRQGTTQEFITSACQLNPKKILYISCDPKTLARDLAQFRKEDYVANEVDLVDMFPYTKHIESVVLLQKRNWSKPRKFKK